MNIIYNKYTGIIDKPLPSFMDYTIYYEHFPTEFRETLVSLPVENVPDDWKNYRVVNNDLIKMSDLELLELRRYNRVLSESERLEIEMLNKLKPSHDEVKKAENTIEILTLLSEVL